MSARFKAGRNLWEWWKRVGKRIGDFQARFLLLLFYFLILGPFALAIRCFSDPLGIKAKMPRGWLPRSDVQGTPMDRATRQS
jgi:hypothetical protein